jgi:hypothetical protein
MSALKLQKSNSIKGVRVTQTDGPAASGAGEKKARRMQSIRQLFKKGESSSSAELPGKSTAASDKDTETLALVDTLKEMGQERKEKSARAVAETSVEQREAARQIVIEGKINKLIDDAIEKNSTQLRELGTGAYSARFKRAFTGKQEKLQEQEGFTRAQWKENVLAKHGRPKVTEDELISFISSPQARAVTERREQPQASSATQQGSSRAKDFFDTSDAALEEFGSVQNKKAAAKKAAMKDAEKEEAAAEAEAAEAARRRK